MGLVRGRRYRGAGLSIFNTADLQGFLPQSIVFLKIGARYKNADDGNGCCWKRLVDQISEENGTFERIEMPRRVK